MYLDKYKALAFQSPIGNIIAQKVAQEWDSWIKLLEKNNIPKIFKKCGYTKPLECCPKDIYAAAIWGYGVSGWIEGQRDPLDFCCKIFFSGHKISTMNTSGLLVMNKTPIWFYLLDQWLEKLCRDLLSQIQKN